MTTFHRIRKTEDLQHYAITCECLLCGELHEVVIPSESLFWLNQGKSVTESCPNESLETREALISGMCPRCQKEFFN